MPKWELHAKNLSMHLAFLQRSKKDTSMNIAVKSVNSNAASEKQPIIQRKKKASPSKIVLSKTDTRKTPNISFTRHKAIQLPE